MKYKIESWKFSSSFREDDSKTEVYYSSLASAQAALESAVLNRTEELEIRTDVELGVAGNKYEITRTNYDGDDYTVKLVWWQRHPKGVVCMKDYFYLDYDLFEREVLE